MDAKDLRTEAALGERSNDGNTKYVQDGGSMPCHRNKTYQDITSNSLAKVDTPQGRPCAVIGPDRVVPPAPPAHSDVYYKKGPQEPWLTPENTYRRPPDYPHKLLDYQHPSRNISPRQTFQENMQRIMVAPSYNTGKLKEDHNYPGQSNISQMRNNKLSVPMDSNTKYCDVPYTVNPITNDHKNDRNSDISVSNMNTVLSRSMPHGWAPTSANPPSKPHPQDLCQYPEYQNCPAPRPVVMTRQHRPVHEEPGPVYPEGFYHNGNIRFKPYPTVKERYQQTRYDYISNYSNPFHPPPPFPTHKYDLSKPMPPHPYPSYQQVPLKYLDNRMTDSIMNGYQRSLNQQAAYSSMPYRNQVIHPTYGPVPGNCLPSNKYYPYPPDASKSLPSNKLPFDGNNKLYTDYEQSNRSKNFPVPDTFYINEIARPHPMKGPVAPPNYPSNIHAMPTHPYYRKEPLKGYEYSPHFRNMDHMLGMNGNLVSRFPSQFSPSAIAISPSDSNTSNETNLTHAVSQEDCGYVSQSSTASARSIPDSIINKVPLDMYRRYDYSYGHIMKGPAPFAKIDHSANVNLRSKKDKKDIDVRQFLQMWNEGEEEGSESNNKDVNNKQSLNNANNSVNAASCGPTNQEQLYVLGLVNVPSEELSKYQHIQKVSKLPENIKGYNSIELLHQFEEVIESSNFNHYNDKPSAAKSFQNSFKNTVPMHGLGIPSRPLSPLDVEAKISQSIIHKEVGCNFEIKPCSPKMLNVEVATPIQNVIGERMIEKVSNPLISQSPVMHKVNESRDDCKVVKSQDNLSVHDNIKTSSCKMVSKLYGNKDLVDPLKTNYSIQDLESNSGVCLASLPRLDNDIELNFPEVNQQFINANKVDTVITTGPIKDLPSLDTSQTDVINREQETDVFSSHIKLNPEKDSPKLSKYRKIKRQVSGSNTPESNVQAQRTDSVIIKNPENCKHENFEKPVSPRTMQLEAQNDPINLSVNNEHCARSNAFDFSSNKLLDDKPNDFAIDFSINANESSNFTNHLTLPEISPTQKHDLNRAVVVRKREHKKNISTTQKSEDKDILNATDINKPYESNDINKPVLSKEPSNSTKFTDLKVNYSEKHLNEKNKCKKNIDVTLENPNSKQLQKHTVSDKESLNKKLSSYNLLSSQEKEDTLNEKMRELFGEEFSNTETESNIEDVHDTRAILDDDAIQEKDCVFSDESSHQDDEMAIKCNTSNHCEEEERINMPEDVIFHDLADSKKGNNYLPHVNSTTKEVTTVIEVYRHSKIICNETEVVEVKTKINENPTYGDISNCIVDHKSPEAEMCRIKKELLSPWMQKLILHNEGLYTITDTIETKNDPTCDQLHDIYIPNVEISNKDNETNEQTDFECLVMSNDNHKNNESAVILDAIRDCKTVNLKNNEMDLDIKSLENANSDENSKILANNTAKDMEAVTNYKNDKNLSYRIELKNNLGVLETPEQIPKCRDKVDIDTSSIVLDQSEHISEKRKTKFYPIKCEPLQNDASGILAKANENQTNGSVKGCDMENDRNIMIELIDASENRKNMPCDIVDCFTTNDNETNKSLKNSNETKIDSFVSDLIVSNNTTSFEKLEIDTAEFSDVAPYCKTNEKIENLVESKEKNTINSVDDHEIDGTNSKLDNCSYTEILEMSIHNTDKSNLQSDACKTVLETTNKKNKLRGDTDNIIDNTKENLENFVLESETNTDESITFGKSEICQEAKSDVDIILDINNKYRIDHICSSGKMRSDDSEKISNEKYKKSTMTEEIENKNMSGLKMDSETYDLDLKSEIKNKINYMQEINHSDIMSEELNFKEHNKLGTIDTQFAKNCELDHSLFANKNSDNMAPSKSPKPIVDQLTMAFGSNKKNTMIQEIDDSVVLNNYVLKINNENKKHNVNTSDINASCLPSTEVKKQDANIETQLCNKMPLSHSEDSMTSLQNYTLINVENPIHTKCDQSTEYFSTVSKKLIENPDEHCSQVEVSENKQSISGCILNKDNVAMNVLSIKQKEPVPEELTSCSDVSDESSSSDDENTSDSTDSSEYLGNEDAIKKYDNRKKISNFNAEHDSTSEAEESDSLLFVKSNNYLQVRNDTEIESNDKPTSNKSVVKDTVVLNDESVEKDLIEEDNCKEYVIDSLNKPILNDPNKLSESEKNETEHIITESSIDFSVDTTDMGDSGFILETSYNDETKHEESIEDSYNDGFILETPHNDETKHEETVEDTYNEVQVKYPSSKRRKSLKRSLSDSALDDIRDSYTEDSVLWPSKRKKDIEINNYNTSQLIAQNICRVLQSNRRNSISSIHNDGNVSFCILIDNNCIISEECDEADKICFSGVPEDCVTCIQAESASQDSIEEITSLEQDANCVFSNTVQTNEQDEILDEPWVEDVACVETVISDDIAENIIISAPASPSDEECNDEETENYNINEHTEKLKFIYGDKMYSDDAHFVDTLYRTPQMNVNKTLSNRESQITVDDGRYYDKEALERVLSESNGQDKFTDLKAFHCTTPLPSPVISDLSPNYSENVILENQITSDTSVFESKEYYINQANHEDCKENPNKEMKENMNSCGNIENVYTKPEESRIICNISSSPEVSSTTSEEKNAGILLKITNFSGSRVSQINSINPIQSVSCKYTEKKDYLSSNGNLPTRTLITKAAQKYIPPIKESIRDLKVKLPLPHQSLLKLRQLKVAKEAHKPNLDRSANTFTKNIPKKNKPKFEDVLMSIDELQYQKHKEEKNKKGRKLIPKVVIKKNMLGSHYASTSSRFNPDLTGRKWQPWVFLERNHFIDKMALRNKTRAIFSHRKKSYVLAEKFQKYKSICNPKFVISQPKQNDSTQGQLKYTIRLKHTY